MESDFENNIDSNQNTDSKGFLEEIAIAITVFAIVITTGNFFSVILFREDLELVRSASVSRR